MRHAPRIEKDLSAVARVGDYLFLACDEAAGLERLTKARDGRYAAHRHIPLGEFFDLPGGPEEEMDIEASPRRTATSGSSARMR